MLVLCDEEENSRLGASRPLTQKFVLEQLSELGLEEEYAAHVQLSNLSGGQKVKVVLSAAMWGSPHLIILDEPTNYLDRDSLAALAGAIKEFEGGVLIISHNRDFVEHVARPCGSWQMASCVQRVRRIWMRRSQRSWSRRTQWITWVTLSRPTRSSQ